jgi:UDP-N-acetylglucosamine 4-epimerase
LFEILKTELSAFDPEIVDVEPVYGPERAGDIPHSLASVDKARSLLGYNPEFDIKKGLQQAVKWYWENLQ